ncbi:MAG: hypothetical protein QM679_09655, partial [Patulibacter sp.]
PLAPPPARRVGESVAPPPTRAPTLRIAQPAYAVAETRIVEAPMAAAEPSGRKRRTRRSEFFSVPAWMRRGSGQRDADDLPDLNPPQFDE